jgi:hypothetical protein
MEGTKTSDAEIQCVLGGVCAPGLKPGLTDLRVQLELLRGQVLD